MALRFQKPLFLLSTFGAIDIEVANVCLTEWQHKMGPCERVKTTFWCHGLWYHDDLVAVTVATSLMTGTIGGGHGLPLGRSNTIELARLCAVRSGICRVILRQWRDVAFPELGVPNVISYQDADLHNGDTYRFDGWKRIGKSDSGTDQRSGRVGRSKYVWLWESPTSQSPTLTAYSLNPAVADSNLPSRNAYNATCKSSSSSGRISSPSADARSSRVRRLM